MLEETYLYMSYIKNMNVYVYASFGDGDACLELYMADIYMAAMIVCCSWLYSKDITVGWIICQIKMYQTQTQTQNVAHKELLSQYMCTNRKETPVMWYFFIYNLRMN